MPKTCLEGQRRLPGGEVREAAGADQQRCDAEEGRTLVPVVGSFTPAGNRSGRTLIGTAESVTSAGMGQTPGPVGRNNAMPSTRLDRPPSYRRREPTGRTGPRGTSSSVGATGRPLKR
jgi:hypothetical protein